MADLYLSLPDLDDRMLIHLCDLIPVLLEKQFGSNIECLPFNAVIMQLEMTGQL